MKIPIEDMNISTILEREMIAKKTYYSLGIFPFKQNQKLSFINAVSLIIIGIKLIIVRESLFRRF